MVGRIAVIVVVVMEEMDIVVFSMVNVLDVLKFELLMVNVLFFVRKILDFKIIGRKYYKENKWFYVY